MKFLKAVPQQTKMLRHIARMSKQHWGYNADYMKVWNYDETLTPQFIADNPVYCAMIDNNIAGFYGFDLRAAPVDLRHFWVAPNNVGMGVGKLMLSHAIEYLASSKVDLFQVVVEPNAEGFYLRMGAVKVGSKSMPELGQTFPVMQLRVTLD